MPRGIRDAYEVLQVQPSAVPGVIEAAYRALARLHHPDLSEQPEAVKAMAELNAAYNTLRDPEQRAAYDRTRVAILPIATAGGSLSERVEAAAARDYDSPGHAMLDFGRYEGMTLAQVARIDPAYLKWLQRHSSGVRYRQQIDELMATLAAKRD